MDEYNNNAAVIKVENLLFRKPCLEYVSDLLAVKNDDEAALLLEGVHHQYKKEDIVNWIDFHNSREDEEVFVIVDTKTGRVIGHACIYKIDRRIRRAEYGILIGSKRLWSRLWH